MEKITYLTKEGYEKLKEKYDDYVNNKRRDASEKIKVAREYGDLSENAEYDAAKLEQSMIEGEIKMMEEQLRTAQIISDDATSSKIVKLGSNVEVYDKEFDETILYKIVGSSEVDIDKNYISNESPLAKALLGKKKGDVVTVVTPQTSFEVKITAVNK